MGKIKNLTIVLVILLSFIAYIGIAFAMTEMDTIDIEIQIAPATFNLEFNGPWITVHTDILFDEVNTNTIELDEISAASTFADDCENLVVKFRSADVMDLDFVALPEATLTLTGETNEGISFTGSDTIRVLDPPNKK